MVTSRWRPALASSLGMTLLMGAACAIDDTDGGARPAAATEYNATAGSDLDGLECTGQWTDRAFGSMGSFAAVFSTADGVGTMSLELGGFTAGTRVDRDVLASRDLTYESEVLTEKTREAAAEAIGAVLVLDPEIRNRQVAELDRIIRTVADERDDATTPPSARETEVRAIPGTDLSPEAASILIGVNSEVWATLHEEARDALSRTLTGAVSPNDLDSARSRAENLLSPTLNAAETTALMEVLDPLIVPTLAVSHDRTEALRAEARANMPPVRVTYTADDVVVPAGAVIDEAGLEAIQQLDIDVDGRLLGTAVLAFDDTAVEEAVHNSTLALGEGAKATITDFAFDGETLTAGIDIEFANNGGTARSVVESTCR